MKRVNVVVVKMVVFFVLFGGMLLGGTTRANADTSGCTGSGHGSCEHNTIKTCGDGLTPPVFGYIEGKPQHGSFKNVCLNCDTIPDCHEVSGTWAEAECTIGYYDDKLEFYGVTQPVSSVVWDTIGAECSK